MSQEKVDWIYLPAKTQEISLWSCLHDGEMISCKSSLLERFITLEFIIEHLKNDNESQLKFLLKVEEVTSVRAIAHFRWIGKYEEPENAATEEKIQAVKDYWAKWREESLSWSEFETALATDPLQINDASYVSKNDDTILKTRWFPRRRKV